MRFTFQLKYYYGTLDGKDYLLTRQIAGEDCTHPQYLSNPKKLCDTTALLLRELHETGVRNCPVPDRIRTYTDSVRRGLKGHYYEPDLFNGIWEFESIEDAARAAEEGMPLLICEH